ncbi:hypothetical protein NL676_034790 [Syzygium grande]|nr:hypothetical protein NL676_034790 [Syzygium grande]
MGIVAGEALRHAKTLYNLAIGEGNKQGAAISGELGTGGGYDRAVLPYRRLDTGQIARYARATAAVCWRSGLATGRELAVGWLGEITAVMSSGDRLGQATRR